MREQRSESPLAWPEKDMTHISNFFKALADPTRLRILNLLFRSRLCVCRMAAILGLPQPLVSRHLAYLRSHGLVKGWREGFRINYEINEQHSLLAQIRPLLEQILSHEATGQADLRNLDAECHAAKGETV